MEKDAWERVNKAVFADCPEDSNKAYSKWAEKYDEDIYSTLGNVGNEELAKNSIIYIKNNESAQLLDMAAGTGNVAENLLACGYKGVMDAIEWNEEMLKRAESKKIYRKHMCFKITPEDPIPVEAGEYDTVTCAGSLGQNHLEEGCIRQMVRCLKPGGTLVFNTRKTNANKEYVEKLDKVMDELVQSGQLRQIKVKEVLHYPGKETGNVMTAFLYIYEKL